MYVEKKISPIAGIGEYEMVYSVEEHPKSDSEVRIYSAQKFSILLTDDLAAVVGENVYNTIRGDFFVFSPDEIHFGRFLRAGTHRYLDLWIPTDFLDYGFNAECIDAGVREIFRQSDGTAVNYVTPDEKSRGEILTAAEKCAAILYESPSDDHTKDLTLFALTFELLGLLAAAYKKQSSHPDQSSVSPVVSKTLRFINENYTDELVLEALAENAGCSVTYLAKVFKRHTGKTIHGYLTERRIAAAEQLLKNGATVTEACYGAGFGNCSGFIKVFRRYTGKTLGEYRECTARQKRSINS